MGDRLLRLPAVKEKTGLSRTTLYRWVQEGRFPRPVSLGPNTVAWRESELDRWIAQLAKAS